MKQLKQISLAIVGNPQFIMFCSSLWKNFTIEYALFLSRDRNVYR